MQQRGFSLVSEKGWQIASLLLVGIWITTVTIIVVYRHNVYNSTYYDLGIYDYATWHISQGDLGALTRTFHVEPILYLFAVAYRVVPDPRLLLIVQTIALGAAGLGVHRIAARHWKSAAAGFAFTILYLLAPYLGWISLDFHPVALSIPFFIFAFDAADQKKYGSTSLWLLAALMCKEDIGLSVAAFGVYFYLRNRWRMGILWAVGGVVWTAFTLFLVLHNPHNDRYSWLLTSNPQDLISSFINLGSYRVLLLGILFVPWLFMPLLRPDILAMGIPHLAAHLLSGYLPQLSIYYHYPANYVPFLMIAGVMGSHVFWQFLGRRGLPISVQVRLMREVFGLALFLGTLLVFLTTAPFLVPIPHGPSSALAGLDGARQHITPDQCLITMNNIAPHFAHRDQIILVGSDQPGCSTVLLDLTDSRFHHLLSLKSLSPLQIACNYFVEGGYQPVFYRDGALLLRRRAEPLHDIRTMLEKDCAAGN